MPFSIMLRGFVNINIESVVGYLIIRNPLLYLKGGYTL
jgi:hypothetical protein